MRCTALRKECSIVFLAAAFLWSMPIPAQSNEIEPKAATGEIRELLVPAPSLEGNILGDQPEQPVSIYLPPSYSKDPEARYPVIYLLAGLGGTNRTWLYAPDASERPPNNDSGYQHAAMLKRDRLDRLFVDGDVPEMIIVAPNGRNALKVSHYVNSSVTGNWEDHIADDVVSYVDANFRTIAGRSARGLAGHSTGGMGALFFAMRHADTFASVYAMAPCCLGPNYGLPPFTQKDGETPTAFWQEVFAGINATQSIGELPGIDGSRPVDFHINEEVSAAAAYAPNPQRPPFYGDPLFQMSNGQWIFNEDAWQRRQAMMNYYLVDEHTDDLKSLEGILIDFGEHEFPQLKKATSLFVQKLSERGIPFSMEVYAGGDHGNMIVPRFESVGLRFFAQTLSSEVVIQAEGR